MRQNAGRKTLRLIDAEFDIWAQGFRERRRQESTANEKALQTKVLDPSKKGKGGKKEGKADGETEEWDWRYAARPCTKKDCAREPYSVFDQRFYLWYHTPRKSGLGVLRSLCPVCARKDIDEVERRMRGKWQEMHPQQWREWMEQVKRDRAAEQNFGEKAQESRVREYDGVVKIGKHEEEDVTAEKNGNLLEELCVVM